MSILCDTCHEIIEGKSIRINGKQYHPEHFLCARCGKVINMKKQYFHTTYDGKPLCGPCDAYYQKTHDKSLPICEYCHEPIKEDDMVCLNHIFFHKKHFRCQSCNKKLAGQAYAESDGKILCQQCYEAAAVEICIGCRKTIMGEYTVANNQTWHKDCFTCKICNKTINGEYKLTNGYPTHKDCTWSVLPDQNLMFVSGITTVRSTSQTEKVGDKYYRP